MFIASTPVLYFFSFFGVKLGHFTISEIFAICNKRKSLPTKSGKNLCEYIENP